MWSDTEPLFSELDQEIFDRELAEFLPPRIFDAHAHLMHSKIWNLTCGGMLPEICGLQEFRKYNGMLHPGRELGALLLNYVRPENDVAFANQWLADQVRDEPSYRWFMCVAPDDEPDFIREEVIRLGTHGFKVYHDRATCESTWEADIPEYMPEWLVQIAHELGLGITLHMVKRRGVSDPSNIHWIRHFCEKYPDMKLILAHSARGFQGQHNVEGLPKLAGLRNLYFDTSANCSTLAHVAIIKLFGHERLMYGSDSLSVGHMRGTNFGAGNSFVWVSEKDDIWGQKLGKLEPSLVGIEHMRSVKYACWTLGLSDSQVEDIFWNNAAKLFNLP